MKKTNHTVAENIINSFEGMRKEKSFEIMTSGGKQNWKFKYNDSGELLVKPPQNTRYTKVLYPASTLAAIAKGMEYFELHVQPLQEVNTDEPIPERLLMIKIEAPCF